MIGRVSHRVRDLLGRGQQPRVILVLAGTLGLSGADFAAVSATADDIEHTFGVGNAEIGLLVSVVTLTGAAMTVPVGVLSDRVTRTRLLAFSILAWGAAMLLSGAAPSYPWLLGSRGLLGAVTATTGPTVASLTGDYFPANRRARIYGMILGGELVGTGLGFIAAGEISSAVSWRFAIWWLVPVSVALAWAVHRLPEPTRGGQAWLSPPPSTGSEDDRGTGSDTVRELVDDQEIRPDRGTMPARDPASLRWWRAVGYVLSIRTNLVIILASALGYFFSSGLRSFAIIYSQRHYGLSKPTASALTLVVGAGALVGLFAGGRLTDRLLDRGHLRARVAVPTVCLLSLAALLAPGVATSAWLVALPLLTAGAAVLGAANPPLDAARLDIVPSGLWGRAESVRTVLRSVAEGAAPLLFGVLSELLARRSPNGLEYTFLIFLVPLPVAGLLSLLALRTYPRDVASAAAADRR